MEYRVYFNPNYYEGFTSPEEAKRCKQNNDIEEPIEKWITYSHYSEFNGYIQ